MESALSRRARSSRVRRSGRGVGVGGPDWEEEREMEVVSRGELVRRGEEWSSSSGMIMFCE